MQKTIKTKMPERKSKGSKTMLVIVMIFISLTFLLCLFIAFGFLKSLIPNPNLYSVNKNTTYAKAQYVIDHLNLTGEIVHSKVSDGCDDYAGYFRTRYSCRFTAQKYVKNSGDLRADLIAADKSLKALGFTTSGSLLNTDQPLKTLDYTPSAKEDHMYDIHLGFYKVGDAESQFAITDLITERSINEPTGSDYVYGVTLSVPYLSCADGAWYQAYCPAKP